MTDNETITPSDEAQNRLHQVMPLSKYLALILFILLPFLGGYIGYVYTPEKVVVREVVVREESVLPPNETPEDGFEPTTATSTNDKFYFYYIDDTGKEIKLAEDALEELGNPNQIGPYFVDQASNRVFMLRAPLYIEDSAQNVGLELALIPDAAAGAFRVYDDHVQYATDGETVYFVSGNAVIEPSENYLYVIEEADPVSFEPNFDGSGNYFRSLVSRDDQHVFFKDEVIAEADPISFSMESVATARDADSVFLWFETLDGADLQTYRVIRDTSTAGPGTVHAEDAINYFVDYCIFPKPDADSSLRTTFADLPVEIQNLSNSGTGGVFRTDAATGECLIGEGVPLY